MARKKLTLAFITKDSSRKATFKKRKTGLLKKTSELSTLCGISTCIIVYGLNEITPETWPAEPREVFKVIRRFKELPEMDQAKKKLNQEGFSKQRVAKLREQRAKIIKENRDVEMRRRLLEGLSNPESLKGVGIEEVNALLDFLEAKYERVKEKQEGSAAPHPDVPSSSTQPPAAPSGAPGDLGNEEQRVDVEQFFQLF